jgi:hypothetical protein
MQKLTLKPIQEFSKSCALSQTDSIGMGAVPPKSKRKPVEEVLEDTSPEVTS